jgi:DNA-binding transcriptional LysR family regulator
METLLALAGAGVGIAIAPQGLVQRRAVGLAVKALPASAPRSDIGLAIRSDQDWPLTGSLLQLALKIGDKASSWFFLSDFSINVS